MPYSPGHGLARGSIGAAFRDRAFLLLGYQDWESIWWAGVCNGQLHISVHRLSQDVWSWLCRLRKVSPFPWVRVGIISGKAEGGVWWEGENLLGEEVIGKENIAAKWEDLRSYEWGGLAGWLGKWDWGPRPKSPRWKSTKKIEKYYKWTLKKWHPERTFAQVKWLKLKRFRGGQVFQFIANSVWINKAI